jgi:hypothetical protein
MDAKIKTKAFQLQQSISTADVRSYISLRSAQGFPLCLIGGNWRSLTIHIPSSTSCPFVFIIRVHSRLFRFLGLVLSACAPAHL